jgi:hypothetical protein
MSSHWIRESLNSPFEGKKKRNRTKKRQLDNEHTFTSEKRYHRILLHTGMWIMGAPPKYEEKSSAFRVALISISLSSGRLKSNSFSTISKKSEQN